MGIPYAEVIGDPIAHSKSPPIHKFWLEKLGIEGDYRATARHAPTSLPTISRARRDDPDWRGCNVTMPHKQAALAPCSTAIRGVARSRRGQHVVRDEDGG